MIKKRQKTLVRFSFFCNFARRKKILLPRIDAAVAQLVEHQLPKLRVAGSSPVCRSIFLFVPTFPPLFFSLIQALDEGHTVGASL